MHEPVRSEVSNGARSSTRVLWAATRIEPDLPYRPDDDGNLQRGTASERLSTGTSARRGSGRRLQSIRFQRRVHPVRGKLTRSCWAISWCCKSIGRVF
jgi:hypothetical protein